MGLLNEDAIARELAATPGWQRAGEAIVKAVKLDDFKEAMSYVNEVAQIAEGANHHPDIAISWNRVTLTLTTHSAGGLTDNDFTVARRINDL